MLHQGGPSLFLSCCLPGHWHRDKDFKHVFIPPHSVPPGMNCFHIAGPIARRPIILQCKSIGVLVPWFLPRLPKLTLHENLPHPQTVIMELPVAPERSIKGLRLRLASFACRVLTRLLHHFDCNLPGVVWDSASRSPMATHAQLDSE